MAIGDANLHSQFKLSDLKNTPLSPLQNPLQFNMSSLITNSSHQSKQKDKLQRNVRRGPTNMTSILNSRTILFLSYRILAACNVLTFLALEILQDVELLIIKLLLVLL